MKRAIQLTVVLTLCLVLVVPSASAWWYDNMDVPPPPPFDAHPAVWPFPTDVVFKTQNTVQGGNFFWKNFMDRTTGGALASPGTILIDTEESGELCFMVEAECDYYLFTTNNNIGTVGVAVQLNANLYYKAVGAQQWSYVDTFGGLAGSTVADTADYFGLIGFGYSDPYKWDAEDQEGFNDGDLFKLVVECSLMHTYDGFNWFVANCPGATCPVTVYYVINLI